MGIGFECPSCGKRTIATHGIPGERTHCTACGECVQIPSDLAVIDHVPDPDVAESDELANHRNQEKRAPWVIAVYWANLIINPLFGSMIIVNYIVAPDYSLYAQGSYLAIGIILWLFTPFFVGLLHRRRWCIWGVAVLWISFLILLLLHFAWGQALYSTTAAFIFYFAIRSEWAYMR
ncbi:MAG TPA: hypothetical protein PLF13_13985 [candidate division Zixibacteria bacterium]|nr:hypothetical protein [candidate division Zixibacteria bacterium]